jgi:hypothetical protein
MTFIAKIIQEIQDNPNGWKRARVGVFRVVGGVEEMIGEYDRNYSILFNTFFPFRLNGVDLALYSPNYMTTRIMELPSCKDIGGEDPDYYGFCPVDYFVPTFIDEEVKYTVRSSDGTVTEDVRNRRVNNPGAGSLVESVMHRAWVNGNNGDLMRGETTTRPLTEAFYYPFGFVAGCIWGDDSSDKVQYLDLSRADRGIIKREEKFGYIELPPKMRLKDAVDMSLYAYDEEEYSNYIRLNIMQKFDLRTGEIPDPWDP